MIVRFTPKDILGFIAYCMFVAGTLSLYAVVGLAGMLGAFA